jgi:hypothetical protein
VYGPRVSTGGAASTADVWLIRLLWLHAALSVLFVLMAWRDGLVEDADLRFVVNTTGKDGLFAVISVVGAVGDVRRRLGCVLLLIGAYCFLILGELIELALADPPRVLTLPSDTDPTPYLLGWMAGDVVFVVAFALLYRAVSKRL